MKNVEKNEEDKKAKGLSSLSGGGQVDGLPPAASNDSTGLLPCKAKE